MNKLTLRALAVVAALSAGSAYAIDVQTSGYFRETAAFNSKGGGQACFQLPGTDFKARLGNECDHYFELSFIQGAKVGNVEWRYEVMPNLWAQNFTGGGGNFIPTIPVTPTGTIDTTRPLTSTGGPYVGLAQNWGSLKFNDWGGITLWAGNRYYRRHNVDPLDWFYWNPMQGNAAGGVEDIDLGFGKIALAVARADSSNFASTQTGTYMRFDARAYSIPVNPNGTLEIGLDVDVPFKQTPPNNGTYDTGFLVTLQHNQAKFLGGANGLTFQYAAANLAGGPTSDTKEWRIIENLEFAPIPEVSGGLFVVYQNKSHAAAAGTSSGSSVFTFELRPAYHFSDNFKFAVDGCYQIVSPKDVGDSANLLKLTFAPTFTVGRGLYSRPELRVFVTYASWNTAAQAANTGSLGQGAFGTDTNGLSMGAQYEIWF